MGSNPEFGNGACAGYEAHLEDFLDGALSGAEASKVSEHLKTCVGCRTALYEVRESARLLRAAEPAADPGLGFARVVMARVRATESEQSRQRARFWQPFVSVGWRFAATATLAIGALLTYGAGRARLLQPSGAFGRPTVVRDVFSAEVTTAQVNTDELLMPRAEMNHGNN